MIGVCVMALAAFGILFIGKIGLRGWVVAHAPRLVSEMFGCDFCLSFWTSLGLFSAAALVTGIWEFILLVPVAAPFVRKLVD